MNKRKIGADYEKLAGEYLHRQGYEILVYNYRCKIGEIDIVAKDHSYLVFIEVKYRGSDGAGSPAEAVNWKKQRIISKVADWYCLQHQLPQDTPCRFDVVSILGDKITLIQNAFDYHK